MFADLLLETKRLIIRPFTMADCHAVHRLVGNERVVRHLPEGVWSLEQVRAAIDWFIDCYRENRPDRIVKFCVAVTLKQNGEVIGWYGLGPFDPFPERIELFCGFALERWNQGYATEAGRALLDYGFRVVALPEIVASVSPSNPGSRRLVEKLGFKLEKTLAGLPQEYSDYEGHGYFRLKSEDFRP